LIIDILLQSDCDGIQTRTCGSDFDCSCYGSFFCVDGMCSMMKATSNGMKSNKYSVKQ